MELERFTGDVATARIIAVKNDALVLELNDYVIGHYSFDGFLVEGIQLTSKEPGETGLVVSMHNWQEANTERGLEILYRDIANFMSRNSKFIGTVWLVGNFADVHTAESRIKAYLYQASIMQNVV